MAEIVRAHILRPGIKHEDWTTEPGQTVEFSNLTGFSAGKGLELLLTGSDLRNNVSARVRSKQRVQPLPSLLAASQSTAARIETVTNDFSWGDNPNQDNPDQANPTVWEFGTSEPALRAEYLGHSLRDVMNSAIDQQSEAYDPNFQLPFSGKYRDGVVIFAGPVMDVARISGINDSTQDFNYRHGPKFTFPGEVMLGARLALPRDNYEAPKLTLFAATVAESDGLVRVQEGRAEPLYKEHPERTEGVARTLAEISVFSRNLTETSPRQAEEFPVLLVDHWDAELSSQASFGEPTHIQRWKNMRGDHGIFWPDVVEGLPKDEVRTEAARLNEIIRHAQEAMQS
jgi:hypothetical protein